MLHFPFDNIADSKALGAINATLYNNPLEVNGIQGKALSFNGINQYADYGNQTSRCFGHVSMCLYGFTTVMWLNISSQSFVSGNKFILSSGGQTSHVSRGGITILLKNSLLYIAVRHGQDGLVWKVDNIQVPQDVWFHLGVIWSYERGLDIYINCEKVADTGPVTYTANSNKDATGGLYMQLAKPNTDTDNAKKGAFILDEWYFWESAFTPEFICYIYQRYSQGKIKVMF